MVLGLDYWVVRPDSRGIDGTHRNRHAAQFKKFARNNDEAGRLARTAIASICCAPVSPFSHLSVALADGTVGVFVPSLSSPGSNPRSKPPRYFPTL